MISIIIANKDEDKFNHCTKSIERTIGLPYEIVRMRNSEGNNNLAKTYNRGADRAMHEILIFVHEDVEFKTMNWGRRIIALLENKSIGAVGIAGTTYLPKEGAWALPRVPFLRGRIVHPRKSDPTKEQIELYSEKEGDFDVVVLDGVFIATKKSIVREIPFDENNFTGFHYYDLDFTLRVAQHYRVIVTTSILIKHSSGGSFDKRWQFYRKIFVKKHVAILPFTNQDQKPDWNNLKDWKTRFI